MMTVIKCLTLLTATTVARSLPAATAVADFEEAIGFSPIPDSILFFMLGDFGGGPGSLHQGGDLNWKHDVAERMGKWATVLRPSFVIGLGDNFYDVGVQTAQDSAWDNQFETVYSSPALLDIPWLMCLGNHDYMGRPEAQFERTGIDTYGRWYMPSRSYSRVFSQGGVSIEVFSVDTNAISYTLIPETAGTCGFEDPVPGCSPRFEEERENIVAELERNLNASTATWKIVAGHHPLFSAGHHGTAGETALLRSALLPLFDRYGVDLYACGHDHIAQHIVPQDKRTRHLQVYGQSMASSDTAVRAKHQNVAKQRTNNGDPHEPRKYRQRSPTANDRRGDQHYSSGGADPASAAAKQWSARLSHGKPTDHVTVGTSGPMVMPGQFDFQFERGSYDDDSNTFADDTNAGLSTVIQEGRGQEDATIDGRDAAKQSAGMGRYSGRPGRQGEEYDDKVAVGTSGATHSLYSTGFELWYATKRRAFGVVEASERGLKVSLVGSDGGVLYTFTREKGGGR